MVHFIKKIPPIVWMIFVLLIVYGICIPNYFDYGNISNILLQSAPLLILAMGQTLVVLTQGTDLSLGSQVSFATVIWILLISIGLNVFVAALVVLACTVFIGFINGLIVAKGKISPFIATLGMQYIVYSSAILITSGSSIYFHHKIFATIAGSKILFLPFPIIVAAVMFCITWLVLYRTRFGTNIFGLGGNIEALSLAGVNVSLATIKVYAYAGLIAGVTGLIAASRVESGQPNIGIGWEFESVAAVLLGGTSLREGRGGIVGTIFGVLFIKMLQNGLNISGVSAIYQNAIIGLIVLSAIIADVLIRRAEGQEV